MPLVPADPCRLIVRTLPGESSGIAGAGNEAKREKA
jgi:hypothetical protein